MPILSYEEYEKIDHATPYAFVIKSSGSREVASTGADENKGHSATLHYFGERHSHDPLLPQWNQHADFWNDFIKTSAVNDKRIVMIEGGLRPLEKNREEAISKYGGMGLATFLANQEHIQVHSPEPDEAFERSQIERHFSRDKIQYYYFARVVWQWGRRNKESGRQTDFNAYIEQYLDGDKKHSGWSDFDFSLEHMKKIHKDIFGSDFDEHETDFFYSIINPVHPRTDINKISALSSAVRDEYIVSEIKKYMDQGYSVFIQFGASHAVMQEPLLREIL